MSGDLLHTKLYAPRLRPSLIPRPHLITKLTQGVDQGCKLTLISAPAGFGKTTLVSEWLGACERPFAWLSLDERDSDLNRFLAYLIAALQTVVPSLGADASALLASPEPPPTEYLLTLLLNDIAAAPAEYVLVLDDYHLVDAPAIDQTLAFLLDHLPPQLHLVMTTREDPQLPLPRLRVRGLLTELRAVDLRFTQEETAVFLNHITGLNLAAAEIAALEQRTEGWVAGLQLAALALQGPLSRPGQAGAHEFIAAFAGDDRYIVDYLVDEVLQHQPDSVRRFLLHTSILDQLSGSLCAAVTGHKESAALLETLERSNLFVVPLDDKRQWYRYHHLFADVLQVYLVKEQPEAVANLHRRASAWYEQNGQTATAVHHALLAKDYPHAAKMIELAWAEMDRNRQAPEWLRWAKKLPKEWIHTRPVLAAGLAWASLDSGDLEAAEAWLQTAEYALAELADPVVADHEEFHYLPGTIASARTYQALALGDMPATVLHARQALDLFPEAEYLRRGTPAALLGLAHWAEGELAAAQEAFAAAMTSYQKAGNTLYVITGAYVLAEMALAQGHLREAVHIYETALHQAQTQGDLVMRGAADLCTGLSEVYLEQNRLAAARELLQQSKTLGEAVALPRWHYRWYVAQAKIRVGEGKLDEALAALDDAEQLYVRGPVPDVRTIGALRARIWVAQGRLDDARRWARQKGLAIDDTLSYLSEFDHLTLVRILIADHERGGADDAIEGVLSLLERLLQTAVAANRTGSMLDILVLQALAHAARDDIPAALAPLSRALALAEPEGYVRLFVGEGAPMLALLTQMGQAGGGGTGYIHQLLAAFGGQPASGQRASTSAQAVQPPLVEPLSERELEVLQLVAEGLSNREIAERLFLALSTVKGHNRVIFGKLHVSRRTEAVARARELGLL